uniref:Class I SAM-dependent methyltransferase n=1 Tax=Phenylobacterium glaciei TaxID=2803784 RepID=A0A974P0V7_9CAUL|nr:class I SAM-dependent methyltransferase [Phenylobacterium glaciei]
MLDAGCGSGRDALAFRGLGFQVTAFDGSSRMVEMAQAHTGLKVLHMDFSQVAWVAAFDGIWSCASLLHVSVANSRRHGAIARRPGSRRGLGTFLQGGTANARSKDATSPTSTRPQPGLW